MKFKLYILSILLIGVFVSCEDTFTTTREIDIPDHESKLSVFTTVYSNTSNTFIGHSKKIHDETPYEAVRADVSLMENDTEIMSYEYTDQGQSQSFYNLLSDVKEDYEYTLIVTSDKFGTATSSQIAPKKVKIENLKYVKDGGVDEYDNLPTDLIEFTILDEKENDNFYLFELEGLRIGSTVYDKVYYNPDVTTSTQRIYFKFFEGHILSDKNYNGVKRKIGFNLDKYYSDPEYGYKKLKLTIKSLTKDTYNFLVSNEQYEDSEYNPFAEPVVIHNNIENGYGLFSVYTFDEWEVDVE